MHIKCLSSLLAKLCSSECSQYAPDGVLVFILWQEFNLLMDREGILLLNPHYPSRQEEVSHRLLIPGGLYYTFPPSIHKNSPLHLFFELTLPPIYPLAYTAQYMTQNRLCSPQMAWSTEPILSARLSKQAILLNSTKLMLICSSWDIWHSPSPFIPPKTNHRYSKTWIYIFFPV